MELKTGTYKGTVIRLENRKRFILNRMVQLLLNRGFDEISIPIIQYKKTFEKNIGDNLMFEFEDRAGRELVLAPEYTNVIRGLASEFKTFKNYKLFYVGECFRGEKPQKGRWRQFTQLGVEIINPTKDWTEYCLNLAKTLCREVTNNIEIVDKVKRAEYYIDSMGFEINAPELGAQKQICGGGPYPEGIGFAIGIDRLLLLK